MTASDTQTKLQATLAADPGILFERLATEHAVPVRAVVEALPGGAACQQAVHCQSGFCFDGRCCDKDCGLPCRACAQPLTGQPDGVCAPRGVGDADERCGAVSLGDCGPKGTCAPGGVCALNDGAPCEGGTCKQGVCAQPVPSVCSDDGTRVLKGDDEWGAARCYTPDPALLGCSFDFEVTWAWTSMPITISQSPSAPRISFPFFALLAALIGQPAFASNVADIAATSASSAPVAV